jgi:polar amino acid transport system substrate-binding protein
MLPISRMRGTGLFTVLSAITLAVAACAPAAAPTPEVVEVTRLVPAAQETVIVTVAPAEEPLLDKVKRTNSLVIGTGSYPPEAFVDPTDGSWIGTDIDFFVAFAKHLGVEPYTTYMPASALVLSLKTGRVDVWIDLYKTEERAKEIDFTDIWSCQADGVWVNSENPTVASDTVDALTGKRIGTCRGCAEEEFIDAIPGATKVTYDTVEESFLEVSSGRLDAAIQPNVMGEWGLKENPDWKIKNIGIVPPELVPGGLVLKPLYFAVPKGNNETFLAELNDFIKTYRDSGQMQADFAKYGMTDPSWFSPDCKMQ